MVNLIDFRESGVDLMMTAQDLCFTSIHQLSVAIGKGEVSPVEVTRAYLERIGDVDDKLNSYITVLADGAMEEAMEAEAEIRKRGPRGPLHGIPLALKDIVAVRGVRTTSGSKVMKDYIPDYDATVSGRLRDAGSILLGKLNMNEFATVVPSDHFGRTQNPWKLGHSPGGSSSGSAAAVSAGLCAGALGTDTGGSIRIPAALCGIVGLKATHGRVSIHGVTPLAWSLDHIGPMTRTVRDAAMILQAVAGYDSFDIVSQNVPVVDYTSKLTGDIQGLRIGVPTNLFPDLIHPEVEASFYSALDVLKGLGAHILEIILPDFTEAWATAQVIINSEANVWHEPYLSSQAGDYGPRVRKFLERGKQTPATEYIKAQHAKTRFRRDMLSVCSAFDAVLTPGVLIPAPPYEARTVEIDGRDVKILSAMVSTISPFNLTGQPALTLPCGLSSTGLPLSLQIIGMPFDEVTVLRIGHAFESNTSWHTLHPKL